MPNGEPGGSESDFDWSWTEDEGDDWIPPDVDITTPSVARIYDYFLGGKDNLAVDREAAEKVAVAIPDYRDLAMANRRFLVRAVQHMAEAGITQFVDLGTGIPTAPNVHEVAREIHPDARVVYIDNDPVVIAHNRALRATMPGVITLQHDLRQPAQILSDPRLTEVIDFDRPVGVLFIAVMHFIRHDLGPGIMAQFRRVMAPGSFVAISVGCTDGMAAADVSRIKSVYASSTAPSVLRSRAQIEQLFEGLELEEPGLTDITQWRAEGTPGSLRVLCGVGRT